MQRTPPPSRDPRPVPVPKPAAVSAAVARAGVPHGATETGWLPDFVYTGEKFEAGLAFFADAQGRIVRFSREPADLAAARRLAGQAALPGLVNTHAHTWQRVLRGRPAPAAAAHALARLTDEDVFDCARHAFLEMLLGGITAVGEFHALHHRPDGTPWPDPNFLAREILRAAHDVGIRIALLKVADLRGDAASARFRVASAEQFVRETETLRLAVEKEYPADEAWLGIGVESLAAVPPAALKPIATYARAQRFRLHAHLAPTPADHAACIAAHGRAPVALLAELGVLDKRFTAVDAAHLTDDEMKLLGTARASVCVCPGSARALGHEFAPVGKLLAAGAGLALGTDCGRKLDLLGEARLLHDLQPGAVTPAALWHAATFVGARSLGATGGALEVGRPADFFTVGLHEPSLAGADGDTLLAHVLFSLERRAIRDVWIGARQRLAGGRHVNQGPIVGRFADLQQRLWRS